MTAERSLEHARPADREGSLDRRASVHAALADRHRLAIVDELLVSDRSPSDLRDSLGIGSNLLAHHVDVLERCGLVRRHGSSGDRRRKYLQLEPEALAGIWRPAVVLSARRILFVCTANSARSQIAAALWNSRHEVAAESAGTEPATSVHPEAIRAARRAGLDLADARPRSLDEVTFVPDILITVCDLAHERLRPAPSMDHLHWSIPDPAGGGAAVFDDTVRRLSGMVNALAPRVHAVDPARRPTRSRRRDA